MGKTVIISGGSDGLGYATAKRLSKNYNVYIISPTESKLIKASQELSCKYKVCDVSVWEQVEKAIKEIAEAEKSIDVCINNAGVFIDGELDTCDPVKIRRVIEVNSLGVIFLAKAVIPYMKKQRTGIILNVNSQAGLYQKAERPVYHSSKWAVTGFTKSLYQELSKYRIKVMAIYPSLMNTKMNEKAGTVRDMRMAIEPDEVARTIEFMVSAGKDIVYPGVEITNINF